MAVCVGSRRQAATVDPETDPPTGICPICGAEVEVRSGLLQPHGEGGRGSRSASTAAAIALLATRAITPS